MQPGATYYVNIQTKSPFDGSAQCGASQCNMNVEFHKPPGS
jgi:hypothetical protein